MLETPLWKKITLWALTLAFAAAALPSLLKPAGVDFGEDSSAPEVNLGLDLAGGSHLLLEADPDDVRQAALENMQEEVERALRSASPEVEFADISRANGRLSFLLDAASEIDRTRGLLEPLMIGEAGSLQQAWDFEVVDTQRVLLTPTTGGESAALDNAMNATTEVIRRRIDLLGTREPTILRQGDTRIVVQVPGLSDPQQLKRQLEEVAVLEFKLVDEDSTAEQAARPGSQLLPYPEGEADTGLPMLGVKRLNGIRGDRLTGASAGNDPQTNENVVNITFDQEGGRRFADLSIANVDKRFAIILDGEVISAPVFREPILGGQAQISGRFTPDSANQLAISLQSGALPVPLTVVEERSVSAELGEQSIRSGMIAMLIGSLAVIALMIATYGRFGVYATVALIFNVMILLGMMAIGNFTLTLPGIAGFVLTVGAAVDANVLINERIREERKRGRKVITAVENGYKEASRAIYDANITNFIAGALLFWFGSGPIRGFAVVLVIGLATSVFTALFLTKLWVSGYLAANRPKDLNI